MTLLFFYNGDKVSAVLLQVPRPVWEVWGASVRQNTIDGIAPCLGSRGRVYLLVPEKYLFAK